jgi:hypothetical protein
MKRLKENIGRLNKNIRLGIAVIFFILYNQYQSEIFLVIGVIILATAVMGWCPIYFLARHKSSAENKNIN